MRALISAGIAALASEWVLASHARAHRSRMEMYIFE
jgi:hypothetical protein